jgi:hypothetical protein
MSNGVCGRCAPADVGPAVLVGPLYLDRTGSLPRAQMAADGARGPMPPIAVRRGSPRSRPIWCANS